MRFWGGRKLSWVFLGAPGVGGTYASRMAKQMGVPHISMGDLVRAEIKETALGKVEGHHGERRLACGRLVLDILDARIKRGEEGRARILIRWVQDMPRRRRSGRWSVTQVLNLAHREDILVEKCCDGECECDEAFNIADVAVKRRKYPHHATVESTGECFDR